MQYAVLLLWLTATFAASRRGWRRFPLVLCACLPLSMGAQLALLAIDRRLTIEFAVPLHLCALSGLLCVPMLLLRSRALLTWMLSLGAPGALLALIFPAVASSSHPTLMRLAFYQLHALILCATLWRALAERRAGHPLPRAPRALLLWANAYLVIVSAFNRAFDTNYLFLRAAPVGTPLAWLAANGRVPYLMALEIACMLLFMRFGGPRANEKTRVERPFALARAREEP